MFFAVTIIPAYALYLIGGADTGLNSVYNENPNLLNILKMPDGSAAGIITIVSSLAWGLGYLGLPHILVRFMAISSSEKIKKSRLIAMTWVIISLACSVIIGCTALIWKQLHGGIFDLYEIVPGFLFSSLAIFVISLLDKNPKKKFMKNSIKLISYHISLFY